MAVSLGAANRDRSSSPTPTGSTWGARPTVTWASAAALTSAWARRWPASRAQAQHRRRPAALPPPRLATQNPTYRDHFVIRGLNQPEGAHPAATRLRRSWVAMTSANELLRTLVEVEVGEDEQCPAEGDQGGITGPGRGGSSHCRSATGRCRPPTPASPAADRPCRAGSVPVPGTWMTYWRTGALAPYRNSVRRARSSSPLSVGVAVGPHASRIDRTRPAPRHPRPAVPAQVAPDVLGSGQSEVDGALEHPRGHVDGDDSRRTSTSVRSGRVTAIPW